MLVGPLLVLMATLNPWKTRSTNLLGLFIYVIGATLFFSSHAKALFFLPVFIVSLLVADFRWSTKMAGILYLGVLSVSCFQFFQALTHCRNPAISEIFSEMVISPQQMLLSPWDTLLQARNNVFSAGKYLSANLFLDRYPLDWLPENYGFSVGAKALNISIVLIWIGLLGAVVIRICSGLGKWTGLSLSILVSLMGLLLFQTSKNFYDGPLVLFTLFLSAVFVLKEKEAQTFRIISKIIASASILLLMYRFFPVLKNSWAAKGPLTNQNHSIKISYSAELQDRLNRLKKKCDIDQEQGLKHLIVDDLTYPYFWKSTEPYHAVYVMGWWGEKSISNPYQFFRQRGVPGYVAQCHWLPVLIRRGAVRDQDLCCLPAFR